MKTIILILGLFFCIGSNAQVLVDNYHDLKFIPLEAEEPGEIKGTPYLEEEFKQGKIEIEGKDPIDVFLRYNVQKEEMEIKIGQQNQEVFKLSRDLNTQYVLEPFRYIFYNLKHKGKEINGYFAKGFEGENYTLLIKPTVELTKAEKAKGGYGKDTPASIKLNNEYYILFADGRVENVRLKEKDIKNLFDSDKVKEYFKKNSLNTVEDLTAFLSYLESAEL